MLNNTPNTLPRHAPHPMCKGTTLLGLDSMVNRSGERADALMMIEYRGDANTAAESGNAPQRTASTNPLSRGRY